MNYLLKRCPIRRVDSLEGDSLVVNTVSVHGKFVVRVRVMVFNATFNNISVVSWLSVLLVGESG
jgi:hypothetical protein